MTNSKEKYKTKSRCTTCKIWVDKPQTNCSECGMKMRYRARTQFSKLEKDYRSRVD